MHKQLFIILFLTIPLHASEKEFKPFDARKQYFNPCWLNDRTEYRKQFDAIGCEFDCRQKQIDKLAEKYNADKDGYLLHALLCANAYGDNEPIYQYRPLTPHNTESRRISFIDKAIANGNKDFLKLFFYLFSHNGSTTVDFNFFEKYKYIQDELDFSQLKALRDRSIAKLMFNKVNQPISFGVLLKCYSWSFFTPGCAVIQKKVRREKKAALQATLQKQEDEKKLEQSLREIGK